MQMNGRLIGQSGGCEVARKPGAFHIRFVAGLDDWEILAEDEGPQLLLVNLKGSS
jgi:hypothetical protein